MPIISPALDDVDRRDGAFAEYVVQSVLKWTGRKIENWLLNQSNLRLILTNSNHSSHEESLRCIQKCCKPLAEERFNVLPDMAKTWRIK